MGDWIEIELGKLGQTFSGLSGKSKEDFGSGKPYIPYLNIFSNSKINPIALELVEVRQAERQNKVQYGDIFFTTSSETIKEVGMTSVLLDDLRETYLNSFCFGFRLRDFETLLPEFAAYLLRSENVRHQIAFNGQGSTRYNLSKSQLLKNVVIRIPTKPEQSTIATILTTIDQAIEKTEQLIAKYERIKTGLMQDLLTRGIDEQGNIRSEETHEFKDSALGRIPKEWEVGTFSDIATIITQKYIPSSKEIIPCINLENLIEGAASINGYSFSNENSSIKGCFKKEDVLFGKLRPYLRKFWLADFDGVCTTEILVFRENDLSVSKFIFFVVQSDKFISNTVSQSFGTKMPRTDWKTISTFLMPIISKNEQLKIVEMVSQISKVSEAHRIDLLKLHNLKTALMQDLLTGKVRVDALMNQLKETI